MGPWLADANWLIPGRQMPFIQLPQSATFETDKLIAKTFGVNPKEHCRRRMLEILTETVQKLCPKRRQNKKTAIKGQDKILLWSTSRKNEDV